MLKVPQGTGRIFFRYASENLHLLFLTAPLCSCSQKQSLPNFFRLVKRHRQADIPKSKCYLYRLDLYIIQAEPLPFRFQLLFFIHSNETFQTVGYRPHRLANLYPKRQGKTFLSKSKNKGSFFRNSRFSKPYKHSISGNNPFFSCTIWG